MKMLSFLCLLALGSAAASLVRSNDAPPAAPTDRLEQELQMIRQSDTAHTQKLLFIVKLRDALRLRLHTEDEQLGTANNRIASKIADIMHGRVSQSVGLLQQGRSAHRRSTRSAEEIAADALKHMQALSDLIKEVQEKDDEEVAALAASARKRSQLSTEMEVQQEKLAGDSTAMLSDLGKIRSALLGSAPPAAQAAAPQAAAPQPAVVAPAVNTESKSEETPVESADQAE